MNYGSHEKKNIETGRTNTWQKLKEKYVDFKKLCDRIIGSQLVLRKDILNIISVYAFQIGLEEHIKKEFWEIWIQVDKEYQYAGNPS